MFKLCFYVPKEHSESVKRAVFAAGGGKLGCYDCCSWETLGAGQFRPLQGSSPFIGELDKVEVIEEVKVETLIEECFIHDVVHALKQAHPYEEPAYDVVRLERF